MRKDIETRADIDLLMLDFYSKAMSDDRIGFFFHDVVKLDLEHHLPVIGDFWEAILFGADTYRKHGRSPLQLHAAMSAISPMRQEHFNRWLEIFRSCVDNHFAGMRAEFAKMRADAIANRMASFVTLNA